MFVYIYLDRPNKTNMSWVIDYVWGSEKIFHQTVCLTSRLFCVKAPAKLIIVNMRALNSRS